MGVAEGSGVTEGSGNTVPPLVAVSHGSKDPRAAATFGELLAVVRDRAAARGLPGLSVRTAFLDHGTPSLPETLGSLALEHRQCVLVPVLLTAAYHTQTDIPGQTAKIRSAYPGLEVRQAAPLGPHPLLLDALDRRLRAAWPGPRRVPDREERDPIGRSASPGGRPLRDQPTALSRGTPPDPQTPRSETSVVLAAAGSSDPSANAANAALAAELQETGGWRRVTVAYASAASPSPAEAVNAAGADGGPVVVATYLLAPGYFADKVRGTSLAAGAAAVSDPLGAAPEVADVIIGRYLASLPDQPAPTDLPGRAGRPPLTPDHRHNRPNGSSRLIPLRASCRRGMEGYT